MTAEMDNRDDAPATPAETAQPAPEVDSQQPDPAVLEAFGDLTIAELLERLVRRPLATARALADYLTAPRPTEPAPPTEAAALTEESPAPDVSARPVAQRPSVTLDVPAALVEPPHTADVTPERAPASAEIVPDAPVDRPREAALLGVRLGGLALALGGAAIMAYAPIRTEETALMNGLPLLLFGGLIWFLVGMFEHWKREPAAQPARATAALIEEVSAFDMRLVIGALALGSSLITFALSGGNLFRPVGVIAWAASIVLWAWALAPTGWTPWQPLRRWRSHLFQPGTRRLRRLTWVTVVLLAIIAVGAVLRLADLPNLPPEMTSDHVEKLLDSQRVLDGTTQIFFQNNGGREPLQMYVMAAVVRLTGLPMDFDTLKLVTALEGILSIPLMFWLGRELVGRENRRLGLLVGLALAGLVAVSYWHIALSRLALRIVYTPLITALILIYLTRALRDNQRVDWINTGLALGVGLYMYQAVRMLPVVIVIGLLLALVLRARSWVERTRYVVNFLALVVIAFAVFVPLFRFTYDYPADFLRRTSGRLFGDSITQTTDDEGNLVARQPTLDELWTAFQANLPVLTQNLRNALLMYHWKGDVAWINGAPNKPAFDAASGALLVAGLGAWLAWMLRRRDPALWLIPPAIFVMILPSALAIAFPIENPSATRMSGTLPEVYLLAAFAFGLLLLGIGRVFGGRAGVLLAGVLFTGVLAFSAVANADTYFRDFRQSYLISSKPYSDAGAILRQFALTEGGYGNAFLVAYPYWWDHRALGIDGGRIDWPNGIVSRDDIPTFLRDAALRADAYRLDANKPLLFFYSPDDVDTELRLRLWFPGGLAQPIQSYQPEDTYRIYRVPALGEAGFAAFLEDSGANDG
ncbi:MAG: glycosyltransferase family 39 protein [Anaerolineae bacterium]|nr:glycosyltransferase family 39 protein [Anaerolineae bacterium]